MESVHIAALSAAFLCSLVAGFLMAFALVAIPGLAQLDDRSFIRGFQAIDGVIQNNQPVFLLVWLGSVVALLAAAGLGIVYLAGTDRWLVVSAAAVYLLGVQLPTIAINLPLNRMLQTVDVAAASDAKRRAVRQAFEARWTRANSFRTVLACVTSALLMLLLVRL